MPHRYSFPSTHHALLRRVTLLALLLAGGSGIAWDYYNGSHRQLNGINEKMGLANDVLLSRTVGIRTDAPILDTNVSGQAADVSRRFGAEPIVTGAVVSTTN